MTLYDFVDSWLTSGDCPANYPQMFSKIDLHKGLLSYAQAVLKKSSLSADEVKQAVVASDSFLAAKKAGTANKWQDFPEAEKLKSVDLGMAVWEGYNIDFWKEQILRDMVQEGVRILTPEQAKEFFASVDEREKYGPLPSNSAHGLVIEKDKDGTCWFVGIDNSTRDAWTEEFKTIGAARKWLDGLSSEEAYELDAKGEQPEKAKSEKTLEELCDEPIQGETNIGGVHVIVSSRLKNITYNEAVNYINYVEKGIDRKKERLVELELSAVESNDHIAIDYTIKPIAFQRIRRITGYLVGDLNRWGNAKKAELRDRVKHTNARGR